MIKKKVLNSCLLSALFGIVLMPAMALADHPFSTDDTGMQGKGGNKVEVFYNAAKSKEAGTKTTARGWDLIYTRGLTDVVDAYVAAPWLSVSETGNPTHKGWGNIAAGLIWLFHDNEQTGLSFAIRPKIALPVSSGDEAKGLGNGKTSYGLMLMATQATDFGEVNFNLEVARADFDDPTLRQENRLTTYRVAVSPVWAVTENWRLGMDIGVQTNPDRTKDSTMGYVGLGVAYMVSDDLFFGFGVARDVHDGAAESTSATLGVTWRFR